MIFIFINEITEHSVLYRGVDRGWTFPGARIKLGFAALCRRSPDRLFL
jgi:hypothetical protein